MATLNSTGNRTQVYYQSITLHLIISSHEMHAHEMHAHEVHTHEMDAYGDVRL
jgi:hypothetical protein